jgi:hypothetical protein
MVRSVFQRLRPRRSLGPTSDLLGGTIILSQIGELAQAGGEHSKREAA